MFPKIKQITLAVVLAVAAVAGISLTAQHFKDAVATLASAVWGS